MLYLSVTDVCNGRAAEVVVACRARLPGARPLRRRSRPRRGTSARHNWHRCCYWPAASAPSSTPRGSPSERRRATRANRLSTRTATSFSRSLRASRRWTRRMVLPSRRGASRAARWTARKRGDHASVVHVQSGSVRMLTLLIRLSLLAPPLLAPPPPRTPPPLLAPPAQERSDLLPPPPWRCCRRADQPRPHRLLAWRSPSWHCRPPGLRRAVRGLADGADGRDL